VLCVTAALLDYSTAVQLYLALRLIKYAPPLLLFLKIEPRSLAFEFASLVMLRWREPHMPRPYKIPGGIVVCCLLWCVLCAVYCVCL
jgi:hypothetical protein